MTPAAAANTHARWTAWLLALAMLLAAAAQAQILTRPLPDDAKRATISFVQDMYVSVDGTTVQLAPGALIRDRNNLIIVPSALPSGGALAEYTLDGNGQIFRVWLLTAEEAAREKRRR